MKSLIKMQFDQEIAKKVGVDCAIMLENLRFWCQHNQIKNKNENNGAHWTYNSAENFTEFFPFWSARQIRRILNTLSREKYILVGSFNKAPYDRTSWYTTLDRNGNFEFTKRENGNSEVGTPIPDNKQQIKNKGVGASYEAPPPDTYKTKQKVYKQKGLKYKPKDKTEKQARLLEVDRVIKEFRAAAEAKNFDIFSNPSESRNKKIRGQIETLLILGKDLTGIVDWWFSGAGEWCEFSPDTLFSESQFEKFKVQKIKKPKYNF